MTKRFIKKNKTLLKTKGYVKFSIERFFMYTNNSKYLINSYH